MKKKLKKLEKALHELGIKAVYEHWEDENLEFITAEFLKKKHKAIITFCLKGKIEIHISKVVVEYDDPNMKKIF